MSLVPNSASNFTTSYKHEVDEFLTMFEAYLEDLLQLLDSPVRSLARKTVLSGGKRIRPLLCFHSSDGKKNNLDNLLKAASVLELVHVATLVHDDILDNASIRRNQKTIHTHIGDHNAILLGDALFSFALEIATDFPSNFFCRIVSQATRKTCSGEIHQTFSRGDYSIDQNQYFGFIKAKTGELFRASCQAGAYISNHSSDKVITFGEFGASLGLIYQIFDDMLDSFGDSNSCSKSLGTDFDTGKVTLPILLLMQDADEYDRLTLSSILKTKGFPSDRTLIFDLFCKYDILEKCKFTLMSNFEHSKSIAESFQDEAIFTRLSFLLLNFEQKLNDLSMLKTRNFLAV